MYVKEISIKHSTTFRRHWIYIVKILGEKHPKVAVVTNNMGYLYSQMKKMKKHLNAIIKFLKLERNYMVIITLMLHLHIAISQLY